MASAYTCAMEGGPAPGELTVGWMIERFGSQAILGARAMTVRESIRISLALDIYRAALSKKSSADWVKWTELNPGPAALLEEALEAIRELSDG